MTTGWMNPCFNLFITKIVELKIGIFPELKNEKMEFNLHSKSENVTLIAQLFWVSALSRVNYFVRKELCCIT